MLPVGPRRSSSVASSAETAPRALTRRDDDFVDLLQEGADVLFRKRVRLREARRGDVCLRGVQHLTGAAAARSTVAVVVEVDVSHGEGV